MTRSKQINLHPWLDDWLDMIAERYGITKSDLVRSYIYTGIIFWSHCTRTANNCELLNRLELCKRAKDEIFFATMTTDEALTLIDDLGFWARTCTAKRTAEIEGRTKKA